MTKRAIFSFVILGWVLMVGNGCANHFSKKETAPDPALIVLSRASEQVHEEIMTTSLLMRGNQQSPQQTLLPRDYQLMVPLDFNWVGPAWPAIEHIAASIGYQARLSGRRPLSDPTITVASSERNSTVYDLLNDINWQIQTSGGQLIVDSINHYITLAYGGQK